MDIQQIFYLLGIAYFSLSLVILLVVLFGLLAFYRKLNQLKEDLSSKLEFLAILNRLARNKKLKKLAPLLTAIPIVLKAISDYHQRLNEPDDS